MVYLLPLHQYLDLYYYIWIYIYILFEVKIYETNNQKIIKKSLKEFYSLLKCEGDDYYFLVFLKFWCYFSKDKKAFDSMFAWE